MVVGIEFREGGCLQAINNEIKSVTVKDFIIIIDVSRILRFNKVDHFKGTLNHLDNAA